MKKIVSMLVIVSFLMIFPLKVYASQPKSDAFSELEYYEDGSFAIITIQTEYRTRGTRSGTKNYSYYNSGNELQWTVTLKASFNYTGTSANCISSSTTYSVSNSAWQITKATASYSGSTATGEFTAKKYFLNIPVQTVNKTLTLTCSPTGVLS